MKKALILLFACLLLVCSVAAAEAPANYPEIRIDPLTGKAYDLGGKTVYILDYWSGDGDRSTAPTEEQQAMYDYQDWLMETYNCTIVQKQCGDWGTCAEEMINYYSVGKDDTLRVYIIEPGKVGSLVANGVAADWNRSVTVNMNSEHWNKATTDLLTIGSSVFGTSVGNSEPRGVLFFNKRLLEESGIDWNSLYDMQAAGTWTWDAWEAMLKKATRDTDNDGVIDVWGVGGSADDMYVLATFANGGSFFDFDADGLLQPTMDSAATLEALNWASTIQKSYWMNTPEDASWDWYKTSWKNGDYAFYVYQAFGGFNDRSEMSGMEDEWGCVAFPTGDKGGNYVTVVSENAALIPNVYTDDEISMITMIYELWTQPTPGYNDPDAWIGNKYNYTDDRAVDETYAMLRKGKHGRTNKVSCLGTQNDILGVSLLWSLPASTPAELIEAGMPAWQDLCDAFNATLGVSQPAVTLDGLDVINLPKFMVSIGTEAFANTGSQVIILPDGCTTIGSRAFYQAPVLKYVVVPASVKSIATDGFDGLPSGTKVLVQPGSYAARFCNKYEIPYIVVSDEAMDKYVSQVW